MFEYKATVVNIVDGDTVDAQIDLGFKLTTHQRLRIARIDTPERGKTGFLEATEALRNLLLNKKVIIRTEKASKWGYYLAEILLEDSTNISDKMIEGGFAKPYDGKKKEI